MNKEIADKIRQNSRKFHIARNCAPILVITTKVCSRPILLKKSAFLRRLNIDG